MTDSQSRQDDTHERVEQDKSLRQAEGNFAKAAGVGAGMFFPAIVILLVGIAVILYFVLR